MVGQILYSKTDRSVLYVVMVLVKGAYIFLFFNLIVSIFGAAGTASFGLALGSMLLCLFFVSAVAALKSTQLQSLLFYSSSQQLILAILPLIVGYSRIQVAVFFFYFLIYAATLTLLVFYFPNNTVGRQSASFSFLFSIVSLSGLPPFIGFFIKIFVGLSLAYSGYFFLTTAFL